MCASLFLSCDALSFLVNKRWNKEIEEEAIAKAFNVEFREVMKDKVHSSYDVLNPPSQNSHLDHLVGHDPFDTRAPLWGLTSVSPHFFYVMNNSILFSFFPFF